MNAFSELLDKREVRIRRMFGEIAPWYDFLNHFLSLNIDKRWRRKVVRSVPLTTGPLLDLCTGTGDLALCYREKHSHAAIIGVDSCEPMLRIAVKKTVGRNADIEFLEADAQFLPFPENIFEATTVAFGLRNITDPHRGLAEMVRVTKPGGRVAVLEFSKPRSWILGRIYRFYFRRILPKIGQLLSKSQDDAYSYLPASVQEFPDGKDLVVWMEAAGLSQVRFEPLTLGIATLYVGVK